MDKAIVIDTPEGIAFARLLSLRGALSLETKGLKRRGPSAYSILKRELNLKGSRESVLKQVSDMIDEALQNNPE